MADAITWDIEATDQFIAWYDDLPERLSRPVRVCDYKIKAAVEWCKERLEHGPEKETGQRGGIVWHHHPEIGRWLCEYLKAAGVPFVYAPAGDKGNEAVFSPGLVVASFAHGVGKNLQHQCQQLFLAKARSWSRLLAGPIGKVKSRTRSTPTFS